MKTFGKVIAIIVAILFTGSTINILINPLGSGLNPADILPVIAVNTLMIIGCVMVYKRLNNTVKSNETK